MSNIARIPFTEMFERAQKEYVRDTAADSKTENKYKGAVNAIYEEDLMLMLPEDYLRKEANITTKADYATGTVTIAAAATAVTGSAAALWTSANSNDGLFKADDEDGVYRVTYSSATELTLTAPAAWTDDAVAATGTYRLIFDRFAIASDFSHICQDDVDAPENVYYYNAGQRAFLSPLDNGEYDKKAGFTYGVPGEYTVKWITGVPYLHIYPADDSARSLFYNYIQLLDPLTEYTTGTAVCTTATAAVTGSGTAYSGYVTTTDTFYLRFDADGTGSESKWYKILTADSATGITLSDTYVGATKAAGSAYTISKISRWPARFDMAMVYGAAMRTDPNNKSADRWSKMYATAIAGHRGREGKAVYGGHGAFGNDRSKVIR